jgi:mannose-1-phosphate guanylyltransferase
VTAVKAFLLAAGYGTRLGTLTEHTPKCLLPVCGRPLLKIWLELCRQHGITDVLINTHAHADAVRQYLVQEPGKINIRISYEPGLLGSAGTLLANRDWVAGEPEFWVLYSDVLTTANLTEMLRRHRKTHSLATLGVYKVADPSRCGIVDLDPAGTIRSFIEKPRLPASDLAFAGLLVATPQLLKAIPARVPADLGYDVLSRLVGQMAAYRIDDYLIDIGTPKNYAAAQREWARLSHAGDEPADH